MEETQSAGFNKAGFYLHACWRYEYPFSVRAWALSDYDAMFRLLRGIGLDQVMIWPMSEVAPPPLSDGDAQHFMDFRHVVQKAKDREMECWLTFCPNVSSTEEIRSTPMRERVFYPHMRKFRLDDATQFDAYTVHLHELLTCLNNADGYVFIDGDPGGYPGAKPVEFLRLLRAVREILDHVAAGPRPKIIPWVWCGWGADWESEGVWKPDLRNLVRPFLQTLKTDPPTEPWELLPGRSIREGHANGRINLELTEEAGLVERSTLMTYEIIEFEPTPPAFVIQFEDIRRVLRQEIRLAPMARGIMGNAQQPITALHNLFYFARCVKNPAWLEKPAAQVLQELAGFFGGDAHVLTAAWQIARTNLDEIPHDLSDRLRHSRLSSEWAECIPGGPQSYLGILADFVDARVGVLRCAALSPKTRTEAARGLSSAARGIIRWWLRHKYVFSGEKGPHFDWAFVHPVLLNPLREWAHRTRAVFDPGLLRDFTNEVAAQCVMDADAARAVVSRLIQ